MTTAVPVRPAANDNHLPEELEFHIGGYFPPAYSLVWRDGGLVYEARERGRFGELDEHPPTRCRPRASTWQAFWRKLDDLGVWSWRRSYDQPVCDGTSWSLTLRHNGRTLRSSGSNGYSNSSDHTPSREFLALLRALRRLAGGRRFA